MKKFKTKYLERTNYTVDEGTMGFHDYVTKYETLSNFFDRVNHLMQELVLNNKEIIEVQYLQNPSTGEINSAIITYYGYFCK